MSNEGKPPDKPNDPLRGRNIFDGVLIGVIVALVTIPVLILTGAASNLIAKDPPIPTSTSTPTLAIVATTERVVIVTATSDVRAIDTATVPPSPSPVPATPTNIPPTPTTLPTLIPQPSETPPSAPTAEPSATFTASPFPPTPTVEPSATSTPSPIPPTATSELTNSQNPCLAKIAESGGNSVGVRAAPEGPVNGAVNVNTSIIVTASAERESGKWYHIVNEDGGELGWIRADYIISLSPSCPKY